MKTTALKQFMSVVETQILHKTYEAMITVKILCREGKESRKVSKPKADLFG